MSQFRTEGEAAARLGELERRHDLFAHTFDGHAAWRLLRFGAGVALQHLPIGAAPASPGSRWTRLAASARRALRDVPALLIPGRARYVVKTFGTALQERDPEGHFIDVYFDEIFDGLPQVQGSGRLVFKLLTGTSPRRDHARVPLPLTTAIVDLLATAASRLLGPREIPAAGAIAAAISDEPGLDYLTRDNIAHHLRRFYWAKRIYRGLFRRLRAGWVLVGDTGEFAVWAAARDSGVRSAEFQHGIFSPNHPDLLPPAVAADAGRAIMPDRVFLYGEYWRDVLASAGATSPAFVAVGSPRIDRYRATRAARPARHDGVARIVVTTQGFQPGPLAAFLEAGLVTGGVPCEVAIKLHPMYDHDAEGYRRAFGDARSVRVLAGSEEPNTFALLADADLHVSISSACHYDALGLGVPTVVVPLPNHEIVLPLVEAGHALLARTPQDLAAIAGRCRELAVPAQVSEHYFSGGAIQAIRRELQLAS